VPLIGFAGAPFTLASYMIEGGSSKNYLHMKSFMYQHPEAWGRLMRAIREVTRDYLAAQIEAGAQAIQMFDSWVGCLSPEDYRQFVLPHSAWVLEGLAEYDVPRIHFGTNTATLLEAMKEAGGEVIGVDWRLPIDRAREIVGPDFAVQGNLDPVTLLAPRELLVERVRSILERADAKNGYIFNLGHGVLPPTPMESVDAVIEAVHSFGS
jgi:uroporphyrinogen decarboxylase